MNHIPPRGRWAIGFAALIVLGLLFYGLRTERPQPRSVVGQAASPSQSAPPPATAPATQPPPRNGPSKPSDLEVTPRSPAEAANLPNFVDLVRTVKPAVVSIRVKADVTGQVTRDDSEGPFGGNPLDRFFRRFGTPG